MATTNGNAAGRSRRRRKGEHGTTAAVTVAICNDNEDNGDYYSDSDEEKGHDSKMYKSACSMGQFFLNPCLCFYLAGQHCCRRLWQLWRRVTKQQSQFSSKGHQRRGRRKLDATDIGLVTGIVLSIAVSLYFLCPLIFSSSGRRRRIHFFGGGGGVRPSNDADVDKIPVAIPSLQNSKNPADIGGWMFRPLFFLPYEPIDVGQADRGYLEFVGAFGKPREIQPNDDEIAFAYWNRTRHDQKRVPKHNMYAEDLEDIPTQCRRVNWKMLYNPTCNEVHEIPLYRDYHEDEARLGDDQIFDSFYVSHGYYRDVWVVNQLGLGHDAKTVIKMSRWDKDINLNNVLLSLRDALVMERLSASPRIVDIYAHCGMSIQVEALPHEIEEVIVPGDGYIKRDQLHDSQDVQPQNDYTASEKLEMALAMAESLADLHGFEGGVIVHDDVQLCQWLRTFDGELKLGDFNRAEIMDFDEDNNEYCQYYNGPGFGNYRSPEEFNADDLDEKIDLFSFGNNIYALLTGLWVFYENEDDAVVQKKLKGGELAYVDPRYRARSFAEKKLIEVMEKCWIFKPKDRIDIFEVVRLLREAVAENKKITGDYTYH